jgi:hypothetical protein
MYDEILAKLLSSDLLTEETKAEVSAEFTSLLEQAVTTARAEAEVTIRAELTEQFNTERELLAEAVDTKVQEFLTKEVTELKEDIESFRDLEAEFAEKLVDARKEIAEGVKGDMAQLIDQLDDFLDTCLTKEVEELKESIAEVNRNQTGLRIFEAFQSQIKALMVDDGTADALAAAKSELEKTNKTLAETANALEKAKRDQKMAEVLEPLSGRSREIMEAILKNKPTDKLAEEYKTYIPRVLHDSSTGVENESEKESVTPVLAESDTSLSGDGAVVVTGDVAPIVESVTDNGSDSLTRLKRLSGINK